MSGKCCYCLRAIKLEAAELLNPPLQSKYLERQKESFEDVYLSRRKAPLGRTLAPNIPHGRIDKGFGISNVKDIPALDLIFPSERRISHSAYSENFYFKKSSDSAMPAGVKCEAIDNSGEQMKELLNYNRNKNSTIILPSYTKKAGTRENIIFDLIEEEDYVIDTSKSESKVKKSRKAIKDKNHVEVLWNLLKIKNHENFRDLLSSFRAYKNGNDKITLMDLQRMCHNFGISVPLHILEKMLKECEIIDKDGALSYEEFIHSLHWKNMLPENHNFKTVKYANDWAEGINNLSEDWIDSYKTTASFIGDHKYAVCSKVAGIYSNKDVDISKLKGVSEFSEHGDASSMIQPNVFNKYGIFEKDLNEFLPKNKIRSIIMNSGIKSSDETFEMAWQKVNRNGKASIGKVWDALKKNCLSPDKHLCMF